MASDGVETIVHAMLPGAELRFFRDVKRERPFVITVSFPASVGRENYEVESRTISGGLLVFEGLIRRELKCKCSEVGR